eukprot:m.364841 g.364841  ORF g.364841 m.364841 type:complete len:538 (+) comp28701_c0_seq1:65-1678(+)
MSAESRSEAIAKRLAAVDDLWAAITATTDIVGGEEGEGRLFKDDFLVWREGVRGIGLFVTEDMDRKEFLLLFPEEHTTSPPKGIVPKADLKELKTLLKRHDVRLVCEAGIDTAEQAIHLACIMFDADARGYEDPQLVKTLAGKERKEFIERLHARTWPRGAELATMPLMWPVEPCEAQQVLEGTLPGRMIQRFRDELAVVMPWAVSVLKAKGLPEDKAAHLFQEAMTLVTSRTHGGPAGAGIAPIVDLCNGSHDGEEGINVAFATHLINGEYTPGLRATRDIEAGEELIVSYGELFHMFFYAMYGACPEPSLHSRLGKDFEPVFPAQLPSPSDPLADLRYEALKMFGYDRNTLDVTKCPLDSEPFQFSEAKLVHYRAGANVEDEQRFRQLQGILHGDDFTLNNVVTLGRLRSTTLTPEKMAELMCQDIVASLPKGTGADDLQRANDPNTPDIVADALRLRTLHRELLLRWEHAIRLRYGLPMPVSVHRPAGAMLCEGCGATVCVKRCARCKQAGFCGRVCQRAEWKRHKLVCKPTTQ